MNLRVTEWGDTFAPHGLAGEAIHEPVRSAVVPTAGSDSVSLSERNTRRDAGLGPQARAPAP